MPQSIDIGIHIQNIKNMALFLKDLQEKMHEQILISKIMSNLLPSYNSIVASWANIPNKQ